MNLTLLAICVVFFLHTHISALQDDCFFEAIYSFGDSLADTGNLVREGTSGALGSISSLPYGMTFPGEPTGRSSDGILMIDFFALGLNLPSPPPYLDKTANFDYGANFAVAGATALDKSFLLEKGIKMSFTNSSLSVQLSWFNNLINSKCSNTQECEKKLEKSLFFVGEIGGNDYNYAFFDGKPIEEVKTYVPLVVDKIIAAAKELMNVGATYLIVPGNFPIGCFPGYLATLKSSDVSDYDENKCLKDFNSFSIYHNKYLQDELEKLRSDYPKATIMYADYYNAFLSLLLDSGSFGLDQNSKFKACCGVEGEYNINLRQICGVYGTKVCPFPSKHISWDGIHPTQRAYQMMTKELTLGGFTNPANELWKEWICFKKIID